MNRDPLDLVRVDAARLEAAIAASGSSYGRLAQRAGTTRDILLRLRRGAAATRGVVCRVAEVLGVDPAELLAEPAPEPEAG